MSIPHDTIYKSLFSHPGVVVDLLKAVLEPALLDELDLDSLEPGPTNLLSADVFKQRFSDCIWRLRPRRPATDSARPDWLYLNLLLEFQSDIDRFMALRVDIYVKLYWEGLIRQGQIGPQELLPPVLPIVLYNGRRPWRAPTRIADLVHPVNDLLKPYQQGAAFLLIDEGRYNQQQIPVGNLFREIVAIEGLGDLAEAEQIAGRLSAALSQRPDGASIQRIIVSWMKTLVERMLPEQVLEPFDDLEEFRLVVEENLMEWRDRLKAEGAAEARRVALVEGKAEGKAEGMAAMLLRLVSRRGEVPSARQIELLHRCDEARLTDYFDQLLAGSALADLLPTDQLH